MRVKLISMHFRYHNLETEIDVISKLNFRIRANGWFLAGLYVKRKPLENLTIYVNKFSHFIASNFFEEECTFMDDF